MEIVTSEMMAPYRERYGGVSFSSDPCRPGMMRVGAECERQGLRISFDGELDIGTEGWQDVMDSWIGVISEFCDRP